MLGNSSKQRNELLVLLFAAATTAALVAKLESNVYRIAVLALFTFAAAVSIRRQVMNGRS